MNVNYLLLIKILIKSKFYSCMTKMNWCDDNDVYEFIYENWILNLFKYSRTSRCALKLLIKVSIEC